MARPSRSAAAKSAPHTANEAGSSMLVSEVNAKTQLHDDEAGGLGDKTVKASKRKREAMIDDEPTREPAGEAASRKNSVKKDGRSSIPSRQDGTSNAPESGKSAAGKTEARSSTVATKAKAKSGTENTEAKAKISQETTARDAGSKGEEKSRVSKSGPKSKPRKAKEDTSAPKTADEKGSSMLVSELNAKVDKEDPTDTTPLSRDVPSSKSSGKAKTVKAKGESRKKEGVPKGESAGVVSEARSDVAQQSRGGGISVKPSKPEFRGQNEDRYKPKEADADVGESAKTAIAAGQEERTARERTARERTAKKEESDEAVTVNGDVAVATEEREDPPIETNDAHEKASKGKKEKAKKSRAATNMAAVQPAKTNRASSKSAKVNETAKPTAETQQVNTEPPTRADRDKPGDSETKAAANSPAKRAKRDPRRASAAVRAANAGMGVKTTDERESSMLVSELNAQMDKKDVAQGRAAAEAGAAKRKAVAVGEEGEKPRKRERRGGGGGT